MIENIENKINLNKRLIFTISTGRSGTGYLSKIMSMIPGIVSHHEAIPRFQHVMRHIQSDNGAAYEFWIQKKLPQIATEQSRVYVETSHLFCKGFVEPLLDIGIQPDLIILHRPARQVSQSMYMLNTIPGRTEKGLKYYLTPDDPGVLMLPNWNRLSDYQLCYWYCLEIFRRSQFYLNLFNELNLIIVSTTLREINTVLGFFRLIRSLKLPMIGPIGWYRFIQYADRKVNPKTAGKKDRAMGYNLNGEEEEVLRLVESANDFKFTGV